MTNTALQGQQILCLGCDSHAVLRGRSPKHSFWCFAVPSHGVDRNIRRPPGLQAKRLDIASCARACCRRIGKASHPWPVQGDACVAPRDGVTLREVFLVEPRTQAMEQRLWEGFEEWLSEQRRSSQLLWRASVFMRGRALCFSAPDHICPEAIFRFSGVCQKLL